MATSASHRLFILAAFLGTRKRSATAGVLAQQVSFNLAAFLGTRKRLMMPPGSEIAIGFNLAAFLGTRKPSSQSEKQEG